MSLRNIFSGLLILCAAQQMVFAHGVDADFAPRIENGKVVVDAYHDATSQILEFNERIFAYKVGEVVANYIGDPGYNARPANSPLEYPGHGFTSGSKIGSKFVGQLLFWDGAGSVNFAPATTQEVEFAFGPLAVTLDGTGVTSASDSFYWLTSSGPASNAHDHLGTSFTGSNLEGIYLVQMLANTDMVGIADSDPIYLVFNNGGELLEDAHEQAIEWVEHTLIPEPASLALIMGGSALLLVRKRKTE